MNTDQIKKILELTNSEFARVRKTESLKQCRIYEGKIRQYVVEMLEDFFTKESVKEMPKASSYKVAKKILDEMAILYDEVPLRKINGLSEEQMQKLEMLLKDSGYSAVMKKAYSYFKLQKQNHVYIVPKNGKLKIRSLKQHSLDAIPDFHDNEEAVGYIVGTGVFNSEDYINDRVESRPIQMIHPSGTPSLTPRNVSKNTREKSEETYVVWTTTNNMIVNGRGEVASEDNENILFSLGYPVTIPFVEIAYTTDKDGNYFIDIDSSITDFNIEYCFAYSLLLYTMIMQNFSLPVFSGLKELMPDNYQISPNRPIFLPQDAQGNGLKLEFITPTPNLEATKGIQDSMLTTFLGIEGIDPKSVPTGNGTQGYTSGFERMVAMMEQFSHARDDMEIMARAEENTIKIVAEWMNAARLYDGLLDEKYIPTQEIDLQELSVDVVFKTPEARMSKQEILDFNIKALHSGLRPLQKAYMEVNDISNEDQAKEDIEKIKLEMRKNEA